MTKVAVVAHRKKQLGGGLGELRDLLRRHGIDEPLWYEVPKSKMAPACAQEAIDAGAELVFVWGGDGTVQRCVDVLAGSKATLAILPAGTANLLASNLGVPADLEAAVDIGLRGPRRRLDVGRVRGERFSVMAGTGFDALMIRDADRGLKDRLGRVAYLWSGSRHLAVEPFGATITVDGQRWFKGDVTCVLLANVGAVMGGVTLFESARPDDGRLDVGIVRASGRTQWARVLARVATRRAERSPLVDTISGRVIDVRLSRKMPYELDGGARGTTKRLKAKAEPGAITIAVPEDAPR